MKINIKKLVGILMLAAIFIAIFIMAIIFRGLEKTLIGFAIAILIFIYAVIAWQLILPKYERKDGYSDTSGKSQKI